MAHSMDEKLFCSAKLRPACCIVETNACCFNCEHNSRCMSISKDKNAQGAKPAILPCTGNVVGDEVCEFAC